MKNFGSVFNDFSFSIINNFVVLRDLRGEKQKIELRFSCLIYVMHGIRFILGKSAKTV
jgi:hypothetical protein